MTRSATVILLGLLALKAVPAFDQEAALGLIDSRSADRDRSLRDEPAGGGGAS